MYERLIQQIEEHATYAPAMRDAVARGAQLILNYHNHAPGQPYCISICVKADSVLPVLGQDVPVDELVHVKGFGQNESQCRELVVPLAEELVAHYGLKERPEIVLNGDPLPSDQGPGT